MTTTYLSRYGVEIARFDAAMEISPMHRASTTGYTREDNAVVTDHYTRHPVELSLRIVQTDHAFIGGRAGRADELRDLIAEIMETGEPVDVFTDREGFTSMVLVAAPYSRSWATGDTYQPVLQFTQVEFASSVTARLPAPAGRENTRQRRQETETNEDAAKRPKERGRVTPRESVSPLVFTGAF